MNRKIHSAIDSLEPRLLLATFVVTSSAGSGAGTLQEAITLANATAAADVINFNIPGAGRPTSKRATGRYRRKMQKEIEGSQAGRLYGQRAQAETVMSMLKRNLGDSLRCRTTPGQKRELMLKALVHNQMIRRQ